MGLARKLAKQAVKSSPKPTSKSTENKPKTHQKQKSENTLAKTNTTFKFNLHSSDELTTGIAQIVSATQFHCGFNTG